VPTGAGRGPLGSPVAPTALSRVTPTDVGAPTRADVSGPPAELHDVRDRPAAHRPPLLATVAIVLVGAAALGGIVAVRDGPPPGGDTVPLTTATAALAAGHLRRAAAVTSLPNPPGYVLVTAPFVAALPSLLGEATWCTPASRLPAPPTGALRDPTFASDLGACGVPDRRADGTLGPPLPPWYRAQGVLALLAWIVLAVGALSLLRASRADSLGRQLGLVAFLVVLPSASSAIVQLFHPQDILSLGLGLAGTAESLRRRWVLAGVLFGLAFLTKQFAILLALPALAAAPGVAARVRLGLAGLGTFLCGVAPFFAVEPRATLDNVSGFSAGGARAGATVLTLAGVTGDAASAIARDLPVVFAVGVCLWAARRLGRSLLEPVRLLALSLACVGSRLVFESVVFPYYLLAASVVFFLLDLIAGRLPVRSLAWCAAAAFFVALRPGNQGVEAIGTLLLSLAAVVAGFVDLAPREAAGAVPGGGALRQL
jgi:hypothetical protein